MSLEAIGGLGFLALFILLFMGMPIGFALGFVGFIGVIFVSGVTASFTQLGLIPYSAVGSYIMSTMPLFVLMGNFASEAGLIQDTYKVAQKWLGFLPGGLSIASIWGCAGFAACTGSSMAAVGTMATTVLPEMLSYGYDTKLATGTVAAGATLGILIPPSIPFIVYGLFASQSIGQLFMAGIIPGIILTIMFCITIIILVRLNPQIGPRGPKASWPERIRILRIIIWPLVLAGMVLGGIWGGIFTPIEAGGMGAFVSFVLLIARRRFTRKNFLDNLRSSANITAMVFLIMVGALIFNQFLAVTNLPSKLAEIVSNLTISRMYIIAGIMVFYLIGGCLMDTLGLMLLTIPIFVPIVSALGFNLVWFGVLIVIQTEMALITPPIGMNVFVLAGMVKQDIPIYTIFRGIFPFVIAMIATLVIVIAFPRLSLLLPSIMIHS